MAEDASYRRRFQNATGAQGYADRFERSTHRHIAGREVRAVTRILSRLQGVGSILDMPSGAGRFLPCLLQPGRTVIEMDVAREMVALSRHRNAAPPSAHWVQGDAFRLPLPDGAVDVIFCNRLLHHFRDADNRARLLKELHRVSRRYLVVSFFDYHRFGPVRVWLKRLRGRRPDYSGHPTRQAFEQEVAQANLRLVGVEPTGPIWVAECYWVLEKPTAPTA